MPQNFTRILCKLKSFGLNAFDCMTLQVAATFRWIENSHYCRIVKVARKLIQRDPYQIAWLHLISLPKIFVLWKTFSISFPLLCICMFLYRVNTKLQTFSRQAQKRVLGTANVYISCQAIDLVSVYEWNLYSSQDCYRWQWHLLLSFHSIDEIVYLAHVIRIIVKSNRKQKERKNYEWSSHLGCWSRSRW